MSGTVEDTLLFVMNKEIIPKKINLLSKVCTMYSEDTAINTIIILQTNNLEHDRNLFKFNAT